MFSSFELRFGKDFILFHITQEFKKIRYKGKCEYISIKKTQMYKEISLIIKLLLSELSVSCILSNL